MNFQEKFHNNSCQQIKAVSLPRDVEIFLDMPDILTDVEYLVSLNKKM